MPKLKFDRNTPFNDLPLLPPSAEIDNDTDILKKLVSASRALASVNINVMRLPNPYMLVNTIALQEAKTSTEIKNTTSGIRPPQANVVIKRGQSELRPGEVIYTPPRGTEIVERLMDNLLSYLNDDNNYPTDPLIKMCIAHYQFEAIHPFQDGNGRTGRIINLIYLVQTGLLNQPVLYLSKYIIVNKSDYYYNLGAVTQLGSWKKWILFMLEAVENTSALTNNLINDILEQMDSTLTYGKLKIKWYTKEVNEAIFSQPYIKPKIIGNV